MVKPVDSITDIEKWRELVFKRSGYECQACGGREFELHAQHINQYSHDVKLRTKILNGVTLCERCHDNFHHQYGYGETLKAQIVEFINVTPQQMTFACEK